MLGRCPAGEPLPPGLADDVSEMTSAILAEADAALRAAVAAVPGARRRAVAGFLADRVTRLAATADEAVSAAKDGDAAAVRRCLRRFEVLTSAVWTAHNSPCPMRPSRCSRHADLGGPRAGLSHARQALASTERRMPVYDPAAPGGSIIGNVAARGRRRPGRASDAGLPCSQSQAACRAPRTGRGRLRPATGLRPPHLGGC